MKLYSYFRSSAAWRVRIALAFKGISHETAFVHLLKDGGQHRQAEYRSMNPSGLIPYLEDGDAGFGQSMAILEYIEETHPSPALLPKSPVERARVRELANAIACDIHPLNNLRILQYLTGELGHGEDEKLAWYRHWVAVGFEAVEGLLPDAVVQGGYCFGADVTIADCCLAPQVFNAKRFDCPLDEFPKIGAVNDRLMELPAFRDTTPDVQPDAD